MGIGHLAHVAGAGNLATSTLSLVAMWFAMMSVMMAPAAWPWVRAFGRFNPHAPKANQAAATTAFIAGYAAAWLLYSVLAAIIQIAWSRQTGLDASRGLPSAVVAIVLIGAGLVQFSSLTRRCLTHCRNPFSYLLARWRNGPMPAWRIGLTHGLFCVGCCWALMATTLVVGMMNVWWMAAIAVATFVQQVAPRGDHARVAIGLALIGAGCARVLLPFD
jgi:predicted metal-binding membrane protein